MTRRAGTVLAVRLDNDGDVLLAGPALRALRAGCDRLVLLAGPSGEQAARLLPGVDEVLVWAAPWVGFRPPPVDPADVAGLVERLRALAAELAVVFTSFHQSPLPTALLLRLAGVPRIAAISEDYPGSLLDVRHRVDDDLHEVKRAASLVAAAGFPVSDRPADLRLAVRRVPVPLPAGVPEGGYVVVHPGASVPARAPSPDWSRACVAALVAAGRTVVVTGGPGERGLTGYVAAPGAVDLGGRTDYPQLAEVLRRADAVVVGNTGPAHLAAAVGTPVVSLFAPVVPAARWTPWGVPTVVLGDQGAACAGSRARSCPVPGHPCLDGVPTQAVVSAVAQLTGVSRLAGVAG